MVGVCINHATARIHRRRLCALENYWAGSDDWVLTGDLLEQRHFEARLPALRAQVNNSCLPRSPPTTTVCALPLFETAANPPKDKQNTHDYTRRA